MASRTKSQRGTGGTREPKQVKHIKDLIADERNARQHNARNVGMIEKSLNEVGAARSIVIDEDGKILAGNGTVEAAAAAGIVKVRVVETDGDTIIAVRRSNLTEEQKRRLALFDNRTAELAEWDKDVLAELREDDLLADLFSDAELARMLDEAENSYGDANKEIDPGKLTEGCTKCPRCGFEFEGNA